MDNVAHSLHLRSVDDAIIDWKWRPKCTRRNNCDTRAKNDIHVVRYLSY